MAQKCTIHKGHFHFDPEDPVYKEHFPGYPVVPGSLIISAFIEAAGKIKEVSGGWHISNFRFKRFVQPGRYAYQIERKPGNRLKCTLLHGEQTVVTGIL